MEEKYRVYIKIDSQNRVIAINSSAFLVDFTGWIKVDEGIGDKYHHAQGNYLENSLMDISGVYNYKFETNKIILRTEIEKQNDVKETPVTPSESERLAALEKAMLTMMGGSTIV